MIWMYLCPELYQGESRIIKNPAPLQVRFRESNPRRNTTYCFHICNKKISISLWLVVQKPRSPVSREATTHKNSPPQWASCHEVTPRSNVPKRILLYYNFISSLNNVYVISFECEPLTLCARLTSRLKVFLSWVLKASHGTCYGSTCL